RAMWLSSHLGLRVGDPTLKNSAIGTRCRGVRALAPEEPGDITICCIEGGWIWIIPFGEGVASVGVVMSPASPLRGTAEEGFAALDAWQAEYRDGAGIFRKVIDHWYAGDFMDLALAPREVQKPYFRRGIVSLLAGDVFRTGPTASRLMADRMPTLARAVRSA